MASAVVLMSRDDLTAVAPRWLHYSEASFPKAATGGMQGWATAWHACMGRALEPQPGCRAAQAAPAVPPAPAPLPALAHAPLPLSMPQAVRDDPMAWNETGDEWAKRPGQKAWISEM